MCVQNVFFCLQDCLIVCKEDSKIKVQLFSRFCQELWFYGELLTEL